MAKSNSFSALSSRLMTVKFSPALNGQMNNSKSIKVVQSHINQKVNESIPIQYKLNLRTIINPEYNNEQLKLSTLTTN